MYGKIFESIFDSSIMEESPVVRLLFQYLIVLADEDGRVDMTDAALARRTNLPLTDVEQALAALSATDPQSRSDAEGGRRIVPLEGQPFGWLLVNHALYRSRATREDRRRQNREAQRRFREGSKQASASVSNGSAAVNENKPSDADADADADAESGDSGGKPARLATRRKGRGRQPLPLPDDLAGVAVPPGALKAVPTITAATLDELWSARLLALPRRKWPASEAAERAQQEQLRALLDRDGPAAAVAAVVLAISRGWTGFEVGFIDNAATNGRPRPSREEQAMRDNGRAIVEGQPYNPVSKAEALEILRRCEESGEAGR